MPETKPTARTDATGRIIREWNTQSEVTVPKRKPVTGIEPPAYRREVFKGQRRTEWDDWSRIVQLDKGLSSAEKQVFHDIFAAEGGMKKAPGGSAVAGILQATLDDLVQRERLNELVERKGEKIQTDNLDLQDVKDVYKGFYNLHLEGPAKTYNLKNPKNSIQGYQILGLIGDPRMASSVADMLFREGPGRGAEIIRHSVRLADPEQDTGKGGSFGSMTLKALQEIAKDPRKTRSFLEFSANARRQDEKARNDYFRFRDEE